MSGQSGLEAAGPTATAPPACRRRRWLNGESPPRHKGRDGLSRKRLSASEADLALGVLLSLAGLLETGLLTLDDAGVTAQVTGLLQGGAVVLDVDLVQ